MTGLGYILAAVLGVLFLGETVSAARWTGHTAHFRRYHAGGNHSQRRPTRRVASEVAAAAWNHRRRHGFRRSAAELRDEA